MAEQIPMTAKGRAKLESDLQTWEDKRPKVAQDVAEAREMGDLRENGQYHAAREELSMIDAKIRDLKDKLARATLITEKNIERDIVAVGAKVAVRDLGDRSEEVYHLVGEGEQDYAQNKILVTSPFGQGLVGHKAGETVEITVPRGILRYKILKIDYEV